MAEQQNDDILERAEDEKAEKAKPEDEEVKAKGDDDEDAEDEASAEDKDGKKVVDLRALKQSRKQARELKKQNRDLQQFVVDMLIQQEQAAQKAKQSEEETRRPDPKQARLTKLAKTLNFFNAQTGEPDLERAQAVQEFIDESAREIAGPVHELAATEAGHTLRTRAYGLRLEDGEVAVQPHFIDQIFDKLPPQFQANPQVANLALLLAGGLEYFASRRGNGTVSRGSTREPVFRENASMARRGAPTEFSDIEKAAMRARGKTPEQWAKLSKQADDDVLERI